MALALVVWLATASTLCLGQAADAKLKASYIYNFALFTTWQEKTAGSRFDVCASPDAAVWTSLRQLDGRRIDNQYWTAVDIGSAEADRCRIIVLSPAAPMPALQPATGVLVIDDGARDPVASITLVQEAERLRFDVDTRRASDMGLSFSSKLLRLARHVS